jgi:hypothetical protein
VALVGAVEPVVVVADPQVAPSAPLKLKSLWSIQTLVDPSWRLIASSDQFLKFRFWMITLVTPSTSSPPPVMPEPDPTPMIVLSDATSCIPLIVTMPWTRITRGPLACMLLINAEPVVTVTGLALPPPVVPAPYPVGVPTADAWPVTTTVNAAAADSATAP